MTPSREQSYESFDNFVIQHGLILLRVARRHASAYRLPNSAAEDICQEALLRAWTRWGSWGAIERGRALGWVCVTEYNVAAEMSRDRERFSREKTEVDFNQRPGNDPEPWEVVYAHKVLRLVADVLDTVPDRQRLIFLLARSGISRKEIARQLGMRPGLVRVQLFRVREKIKTALQNSGMTDAGSAVNDGSVI